jgi:opacity protein-like surface antigen/outer membrane protein OmpA-like peptidoglycan-associated protein
MDHSYTKSMEGSNPYGTIMARRPERATRPGRIVVTAALFALGVVVPRTNGQAKHPDDGPSFEISPFVGYQIYKGGRIQDMQDGMLGGLRFSWALGSLLSLETGFSYGSNDVKLRPEVGFSNTLTVFGSHTYQWVVNPMLYFTSGEHRMRPFVTIGPSVMWFRPESSDLRGSVGSTNYSYALSGKTEPALTYGGGVKFQVTDHVGVRLEVRGFWHKASHFGLPSVPSGPLGLYSPRNFTDGGIVFTIGPVFGFGGGQGGGGAPGTEWLPPPRRPARNVPEPEFEIGGIVGGRDVCGGDALELRATTTGVPSDATYSWTVNGSSVSGSGSMATISTGSLSGSPTATLTISAAGVTKTRSVSFRILGGEPPTLNFEQPRSPITVGEKVTLNATGTADGNCGSVTVVCRASEGTVSGNVYDSITVSFDPRATQRQEKTVRITCTGTDARGRTASASRNISVTSTPMPRGLDDIVFAKNNARVNNCAKRLLLEELAPILRDNPHFQVILIGHRDSGETDKTLDRMRALNTAAVLSAGTGICPSLDLKRVKVKIVGTDQSSQTRPAFCGASTTIKERSGSAVSESDARAQFRRVEVWIVPAGTNPPAESLGAMEAPFADVKRLGCPK